MKTPRPAPVYPPLEEITRPNLTTAEAAFYLNRSEATLRNWACMEPVGVIRPLHLSRRLAWPIAEVRKWVEGQALKRVF